MHVDRSIWSPALNQVDITAFALGRMGPYRLGKRIRLTPFGEVVLALPDHLDRLVEIEFLNDLATPDLVGPEGILLADLAHVIGLRHRHIASVVGAGIDDEVPYVVRHHRMGRTLAHLLDRGLTLSPEVAVGAFFSIAEALTFLSEEGFVTGCCSMGGFDEGDIFLGFDGVVELVGTGLKMARECGPDPVLADMNALGGLAERLNPQLSLSKVVCGAASLEEIAFRTRRQFREACGLRQQFLASFLRTHLAEEIHAERLRFGLSTIH